MAAGGAAVLLTALLVLLAAGWLDGITLMILTLTLPGPMIGDARVPPIAATSALVVIAWVLRELPERRKIALGLLPRTGMLLFVVAIAVSSVFARDRLAALREIVSLTTLVLLMVAVTADVSSTSGRDRSLARRIAGIAGVTGFAAGLQSFGVLPSPFPMGTTGFYRATAGFGWPNELGIFMGVALPLAVFSYQSGKGATRLWGGLAVVGCMVGLLATFSRGNWLAALVAPVVLVFAGAGRSVLRMWIFGGVAVFLLDFALGGVLSGRATSLTGDWVIGQRAALMYAALLMFFDHPIVGVGLGGFPIALEEYGPQIAILWDYVGSAHNGYLHIAAETGVFGLAGLLLVFGGIMVVLLRRARAAAQDPTCPPEELHFRQSLVWSWAALLLASMNEWPLAHGPGQLLALVAALGSAQTRDSQVSGPIDGGSRARPD